MHPELAKRFAELEKRRVALVERVRTLPAEKQKTKRSPSEFSPVEMIMHIAITEHGDVVYLRKTPPESLKGKRPKTTFFFKSTVSRMQNPVKQMPTLPFMEPKEDVDLALAADSWAAARIQIAEYLEKVETPSEAFIKFHFIFGTASAQEFLDLLEAHMNYHEKRFPG